MSAQVTLHQDSGYRFVHTFADGMATLQSDLPPPVGGGTGPSPEHLLAAAVGSCLSSSLVFTLSRFKEDPSPLTTTVTAIEGRNEANRLRVQRLEVKITLGRAAADLPHVERAVATFEEFCTVTASVRAAIPVALEIYDATGSRLK
jgi:uncharacterized OsmC-like protein